MARTPSTLALAIVLAGCGTTPSEPVPGPPYLAIVTRIEEGTPLDAQATYTYRVQNLSAGTAPLDTTIKATPADTVILSVPASTYSVRLDSLPPQCDSRRGDEEVLVIDPNTNTGLARFLLFCQAPLRIEVQTSGPTPAQEYVWHVSGDQGVSLSGIVPAIGDAIADGVPAGEYTVELALVSPGCRATTSGGLRQRVVVPETGGASVSFRIVCSDPAAAPVIQSFHWSYHDSTAAFVAVLTDPNRDASAYTFDLTDCAGSSLLPAGGLFKDGLDAGRTARQDTVVVLGAFEVNLPLDELAGRCASFHVDDARGNSSGAVEVPLQDAPGAPPVADAFDARLSGETLLRLTLTASDPDQDFVGTFAALRIRDGVLHPADGHDDVVPYNIQGYLGTVVPDVTLGSRFIFSDIYAAIVYLIDAEGHFTRVEDGNTFE